MNNLLRVKFNFNHEPNNQSGGARNLNKTRTTTSVLVESLIADLNRIKDFYSTNERKTKDFLIDVYYNDIISKTGRISEILRINGDCNDYIVGARFSNAPLGEENHIITYYVSENILDSAIKKLKVAKRLIDEQLGGIATSRNFDSKDDCINYSKYSEYSKNKIRDIIIDCSSIQMFDIPKAAGETIKKQLIVTFYQTEVNLSNLFFELGIDSQKYFYTLAGKNTFSMSNETYKILLAKVPYMISMVASDISEIQPTNILKEKNEDAPIIPLPKEEPIIGVIDTLFDKTSYFSQWVDYHEELDEIERTMNKDGGYEHGTAVSSIIVDGPSLNPLLNDDCGRFRVRHFGVCSGMISPTKLITKIRNIVSKNADIHVWNLSLGTEDEVSKNFISFDAAELDKIQEEKNVIFVVSGTNDKDRRKTNDPYIRIGSPADSLNSVVVNSVRMDGSPALYSRNGKILSFFNKPDVSYYGGDYDERIIVWTDKGLDEQYGTSFAAPWIARKLCYLIDIMGFSREIAKALLIDSAAGWDYKQGNYRYQNFIGYGVVPKKISNIIESDNSEIKFVIQGVSNTYNTSNYAIPVPKDEDKNNYVARATLCYFPECNRLQGVDYTQRELSIKFGRINKKIMDINKNTQDDDDSFNDERKARSNFRKWENTKFISSLFNETNRSTKVYGDGLWGLSIISKERRRNAKKDDLSFGIVITVKHIFGQNKINDFKHSCLLRGYIVNEIKIKNQLELYERAQEDIKFE